MTKRVSDGLHTISPGWVTLTATLVFVVFMILVLPYMASLSEAQTGSQESPDTSFFYTDEDLYRMAQEYGEAGRQAYVRVRWSFDVIWPLVYCIFLATGISWLTRRAMPSGSKWQRANLVPLLAAFFDFLENLFASVVMSRYPNPTIILAALTPWMTVIKWILVGASVVLLLAFGLLLVWRSIFRR